MAPTQLYVNKPGGVIAHLDGGSSVNLAYGDKVTADGFAEGKGQLADYVDASTFADRNPRRPDINPAEAEAQRRAALTENGQVNSSVSPIPSNYSELDEDAAGRLVANLGNYPEQQASVLVHEMLFGGKRQSVLDSATDAGKRLASARLNSLGTPQVENSFDVSTPPEGPTSAGVGDELTRTAEQVSDIMTGQIDGQIPEPGAFGGAGTAQRATAPSGPTNPDAGLRPVEGREAPGEEPAPGPVSPAEAATVASDAGVHGTTESTRANSEQGLSWDDKQEDGSHNVWTVKRLDTYAAQHEIADYPSGGTRDDKLAAIKKAGHDKPQSPPAE